ncbi:hypothetical protein [Sphingomonas sp. Leaf37]|uniref:hypothetical protein n=1 Tax=Sphingomonas sp. Leaf37 TaxID=2876552 RepID=UPI001E337B0D|nr:hypothetical protein [Sphingomonas sp. Leaf37]
MNRRLVRRLSFGYAHPMSFVVIGLMGIAIAVGSAAAEQADQSRTNVREAYGARLNGTTVEDAPPSNRRLSTRVDSRVRGRLATRVERYRVAEADPAQALALTADDGSRAGTQVIAPVAQVSSDR